MVIIWKKKKYGNKYGNMEIWKYGNMEIWKYGNGKGMDLNAPGFKIYVFPSRVCPKA
jgi:hypothetical protein